MVDSSLNLTKESIQSTALALKAEVVLGVLSKKCNGYGICKINILASVTKGCNAVPLLIDQKWENCIRFRFKKNQICSAVEKRFFSKGVFLVQEDFELPSFVSTHFSLANNKVLKGQYPVQRDNFYYTVLFIL